MQANIFIFNCELCNSQYQYGLHIYEGHMAKLYGMMVCDTCWNGNWDGWASHFENRISEIAEAKGLPLPGRNEKGLLPRE